VRAAQSLRGNGSVEKYVFHKGMGCELKEALH